MKAVETFTLQNVVGSGGRTCGWGGWLEHWRNLAPNTSDNLCFVDGCIELAVDGAHVTLPRLDAEDERQLHWIIPMCRRHNKASVPLQSKPEVWVVSANVAKTCGE
ncbi:hypothetical protein BCO18442_05898 [Burkholderia contaminans]|nr:hypothetical protein BCO18442_05898 [Burkholderia contaminans]